MMRAAFTPEAACAEAWRVAARIPGLLGRLAALQTRQQDALLWPTPFEDLELEAELRTTREELADCRTQIDGLAEEARAGLAERAKREVRCRCRRQGRLERQTIKTTIGAPAALNRLDPLYPLDAMFAASALAAKLTNFLCHSRKASAVA